MTPKKINETIFHFIKNVTLIRPELIVLHIDEICQAVELEPFLEIDQKKFNTYANEATDIINYIEEKTDINKPEKAQSFFRNKFNKLFDEINKLKKIKMSDYEAAFIKLKQVDFNERLKHYGHLENYQKYMDHILGLQEKINNVDINLFFRKIEFIKHALIHSSNRIKEAIDNLNINNLKTKEKPTSLIEIIKKDKYNVFCEIIEEYNIAVGGNEKKVVTALWICLKGSGSFNTNIGEAPFYDLINNEYPNAKLPKQGNARDFQDYSLEGRIKEKLALITPIQGI